MPSGGKREGAGRRPEKEPRKAHGLRFTDKEWQLIGEKAVKRGYTKKNEILRAQYIVSLVEEDNDG